MLTHLEPISFIPTRDPAKALPFYQHTLGLTLVSSDPYALVFDLNGHRLRITSAKDSSPATHTVFGWRVDDINTTTKALHDKGIEFETFEGLEQTEPGIWSSPSGAKVAWFKDPDGNTLSLTELADAERNT